MPQRNSYPDSFLNRLEVVGSSDIAIEDTEKYWAEHKNGMSWGTQKALGEVECPRDIAILGAGRCNDIRLLEIMQKGSVETVDLFDLDINSVQTAINDVKARINAVMPEAINFVDFNPVLADVTFVMYELIRRFDEIRRYFTNDLAPVVNNKQERLYFEVLQVVHETLEKRPTPDCKYDTVVSDCILSQILIAVTLQIGYLRDDLLDKSEISDELWEKMDEIVHKIFTEDHIDILKSMTREGGTIFIASDQVLLLRGKVDKAHANMLNAMHARGELPKNENIRDMGDYLVEELETLRSRYLNGDLLEVLKGHKRALDIVDSKTWEWNRDPYELQQNGTIFAAERVQGVVLKAQKNSCSL